MTAHARPVGPIEADRSREHVERVHQSSHEFRIEMDGLLDAENTTTRDVQQRHVAFQPMQSITLENLGDRTVEGVRLVANDRGDWYDIDSIVAEATRGATSNQERLQLIYQFMTCNHHHGAPMFSRTEELKAELHDPVVLLNSLPVGLCGYSANAGITLMRHALGDAAHPPPVIRGLHGHVVGEIGLGGEYQMMDMAAHVFFLGRHNLRPVSGETLAHDHELAKREVRGGPLLTQLWQGAEKGASQFGADDVRVDCACTQGHVIDIDLRPGEALQWRWDSRGAFSTDGRYTDPPEIMSNSVLRWEPPLSEVGLRECFDRVDDVAAAGGTLVGQDAGASLTLRVRSPYIIAGGSLRARFRGHAGDQFALQLSTDGEDWSDLWRAEGAGEHMADLSFDGALPLREGPPEYEYLLRIRVGSGNGTARLEDLHIETVVMTSPIALPRLHIGENRLVYSDASDRRDVRIALRWRESSIEAPPPAPGGDFRPAGEATVRDTPVMFTWPEVHGCDLYHLQVSRRPDIRVIYRPSFDCYHRATSFGIPFGGIFNPGEDYYWRVRARSEIGVWSAWSEVRRFRWEGPRPPVDLQRHIDGQTIRISWDPHPEGARPAYYRVYGSDERGFCVADGPHEVVARGDVPGNFLGETEATEMVVVEPDADGERMNRCFYRVVAVDERGTRSGCSDYVQMPHPFIVSEAVTRARVGQDYRYQARSLRSLGDLQYRDRERPHEYFLREEITWALEDGPAWLRIDGETGLLSGRPSAAGTHEVVISATAASPYDYFSSGYSRRFFKAAHPEPRTVTQRFEVRVR